MVARHSAEIRGITRLIPAGLGLVFVGQDQAEKKLIQRVVMMTLASTCLGTARARTRSTPTIREASRSPLIGPGGTFPERRRLNVVAFRPSSPVLG